MTVKDKGNLMNTHSPSSNAPVQLRVGKGQAKIASICADERDHLVRIGELVAPALRQMRNPVSTLLATSELLDERMAADDPNRGFVRLIKQETARVHEALSDLSALAEPMPLNPGAIELSRLVDDVLEARRRHALSCGVQITHSCGTADLSVWGDRTALHLAFDKLVMHAIEAMSYGGTVRIAVEQVHDEFGPIAQVLVTDEGPELPSEMFAGLFQPFVVSPGRTPGMRLALCRMIVERLGGRINAWNNAEAGLTVEVRLPLS